jgi:hypothetical protein
MTFDALKVIVTSRPESGLEVSPLFEVIKFSDLQNGEYKQVIKKLSSDSSFAENLIKQVEIHKSKLEDLLCTPLLVTLLVMSYKSFQELPEQLSEFYDSIFQVLLQRHDGVKPGYKRLRRCSFNDNQYRSVFESLCYESKKDRKSIFAYDDISNFASAALLKNRLESDPEKYVEDIIKVTCLILREGKDYRFIHKSVQEYYSAAFVKHRSEPVAKKFYDQMLIQGPYGRWQQELYFLSEIDKYRYNKFFYLPHLCSILSCKVDNIPDKSPKVELDQAKSLFGSIKIGFGKKLDGQYSCVYLSWDPVYSSKYVDSIFIMNFSDIIEGVEKGELMPDKTPIQHPPKIEYIDFYILSVNQMLNAGFMHSQYIDLSQKLIDDTFEQARKTQEIILNEETVDMNLNLQLE